MADLTGFDATQVEPAAALDPIPAGKYTAVITESETKANKAGTGHYLQLAFQIIDGDFKGRFLWARLNLDHPNATAVKIAQAELSAICRAVDVLTPNDSTELHDLPLVIDVRCKKRADTGEIGNEIRGYAKKEGPASPPAAGPGTTPPWKKAG